MELELTGFAQLEGVELLQKLPLFARLSYDETARLAAIIQPVQLPVDTIVIDENALGDALWVIQEGEVKVSRDASGGGLEERHEELGRLGVGDLFGEMSLVDDLLTSARVTTTQPCKLLKMPKQDFERLLASDDRFAAKVFRSFCRTLSDRLRRTNVLLSAKGAHAVAVR